MPGVRRLAIINRGEAAMRCLAAVGELGDDFGEPVTAIALYTDPDAESLFVRQADEAVPLGPALIANPEGGRHSAYLDIDKVMTVLAGARADSVWPGWGFRRRVSRLRRALRGGGHHVRRAPQRSHQAARRQGAGQAACRASRYTSRAVERRPGA